MSKMGGADKGSERTASAATVPLIFPHLGCWIDKDYLVLFCSPFMTAGMTVEFQSYSLHHPVKDGDPLDLHLLCAFDVKDPFHLDYANGLLVSAASSGEIR